MFFLAVLALMIGGTVAIALFVIADGLQRIAEVHEANRRAEMSRAGADDEEKRE